MTANERYHSDPAFREACLRRAKARREKKPEVAAAEVRAWEARNAEHRRQYKHQWYLRNRERILAARAALRAAK